MEFSRPEYWSGYPFPSPRDLPNPGIKPRSPALQADSLPAEDDIKLKSFYTAKEISKVKRQPMGWGRILNNISDESLILKTQCN